jgi:hypothetical protein
LTDLVFHIFSPPCPFRLAADSAVIVERSFANGESSTQRWRIAKVISYDDENGWHSVQYASGSNGSTENILELRPNSLSEVERLQFDSKESRLVLASREFFVIHRCCLTNEGESKSAFDMDLLLTDGIVPDTDEESCDDVQQPLVGIRVQSNFASSEWRQYTVLAVSDAESGERESEEMEFTLVSDEGEVFSAVPSKRIRGLDSGARSPDDESVVGIRADVGRGRESRGHIGRTFPFLAVRRQAVEGQRRDIASSAPKSSGILKRNWSALSLIESMRPIDLNVADSQKPEAKLSRAHSRMREWRCDIGGRDLYLRVDRSISELPPLLRVRFSSQKMLSPLDLPSPSDTTLISLLWQIYERDEQIIFGDDACQIGYSVTCEPRELIEKYKKPPSAVSSNMPSSVTRLDQVVQESENQTNEFAMLDEENSPMHAAELEKRSPWSPENRSRKLTHLTSYGSEDEATFSDLCDGLDEICIQCMEIIGLLADVSENPAESTERTSSMPSAFENKELSKKLVEQLEDPLMVVGGALPDWCFIAPSFAPRVFSYDARRLLLDRVAFGISRSTLKQQESKVNVGRLRQRMSSLRARAVELVGEAFSGGAEDPTALQLQADELYGMEEALAARVRAAFRAERWEEHALQVAKAAINRDRLISDALSVMRQYANNDSICRRRLEVRFYGESGFDAASGDEAGVTRGFYADVAEALLGCDVVAGVGYASLCPDGPGVSLVTSMTLNRKGLSCKLPLWIPDVDASGQVIIPTPRADPSSGLGVFPRPLSNRHPQITEVLDQFRFMGRLFASAMRDGFMFPIPLSTAFLKLVQHGSEDSSASTTASGWGAASMNRPILSSVESESRFDEGSAGGPGRIADRDIPLAAADLPRPGFLGGDVFAVEAHICPALDRLDQLDPPLNPAEIKRRYKEIATDKNFARAALGKSYDCSFEDYFEERTFVDPLDPSQGIEAATLCTNGYARNVTIHNIREWVVLSKEFILHDGVIAQAAAFRQGVEDFFSADYLRLFVPEELQKDVCGVGDNVDSWDEIAIRKLFKLDGGKGAAEALVAVAAIGGEGGAALSRRFGPSSPTIKFVVRALLEATPKMRRQFLSFVTSVPIVTPGLIEVVPVVSPTGEFLPMRDPGCLPRANTCGRRLYLPKFETYESFSQVIWAVVGEESKFKGFYEWRGS